MRTKHFFIAASLLPYFTIVLSTGIPWPEIAIGTCVVACFGFSCLKIVTTGNECLVERLGRYHRKLTPGLHVLWKPLEWISFEETTREQAMDVPPQQCYTLDNAPVEADAIIYIRILSLEDACYKVKNVKFALLNLCLTQLREELGKLTLDETFSSRERINKELLQVLNEVCHTWGVEVTRVEIQNLEPSHDILSAMESQMAAERHRRAAILKSEGEREKLINEAQGHAQASLVEAQAKQESIVRLAKAEAERLREQAEGLKASIQTIVSAVEHDGENARESIDKAVQLMMLNRFLEAQSKVATSPGTKVLMFPTKDSIPITYEALKNLLD